MTKRSRKLLLVVGVAGLGALGILVSKLPVMAAALILHPFHRPVSSPPPPQCHAVTFQGEGITLQGWRGEATGKFRGTMIYLHGVADNRTSGAGVMERFQKQGFDVISYDNRAHGESGGGACTYGCFEKQDLRRILHTVRSGPVVLIGSSLGGGRLASTGCGGAADLGGRRDRILLRPADCGNGTGSILLHRRHDQEIVHACGSRGQIPDR